MDYMSTRGGASGVKSAEAILKGLAPDGGLFVPDEMPHIDKAFLDELKDMDYMGRACSVLRLFLTDYDDEEIKGCVERAYGGGKFDTVDIAPVMTDCSFPILELWHGPTSAFKDMALQLLPQLMTTAMKKTGEKSQILILAATSGDTGKAALCGFQDVPGTKILTFYPKGGVAKMQELQMVTQKGANTGVLAVEGNFDDAQAGVKSIFADKVLAGKLLENNVKLSSANSINWGRLAPQIVYYFSAYTDLLRSGRIKDGESVDFVVPTGNFGDILAGFYAKKMGLPVGRLVCASNRNNVLTDFLNTGIYDRKRDFYKTISPSMDILVSSNLERLLWYMTDDTAIVKRWMTELAENGSYDVGAEVLDKIKDTFSAGCADDERTKAVIREVYEKEDYVLDPHTAVAWAVAEDYSKANKGHCVTVLSTASPYKFCQSVLEAVGENVDNKDTFYMLDRLSDINRYHVPAGLAALRTAEVLHSDSCRKEEMPDMVLDFAQR